MATKGNIFGALIAAAAPLGYMIPPNVNAIIFNRVRIKQFRRGAVHGDDRARPDMGRRLHRAHSFGYKNTIIPKKSW
jgi:hypothetical protein